MNIIEQEDIIKGLPDDALQREARMPSGQVPQFLVVSEIQRRTDMRKRFDANQPQQNMSVAEQVVQEGIGAVQPTMMASSGGRTPFTAKYSNGGGIGFPQMAGRLRRNLRLNRFGLPEQIDPTTEAEFVDYNRGLDVGIGLPIFESYRQEDLGPVPPSMAESNRAALANLGDVISRDQTTRFDLPPDAYATGRTDTPIERGLRDVMSRDQITRFDLPADAYATGRPQTPIERGIRSLNLQREATDQPSGARNMISQFYNEDPFTGLVDPDNKNPLAAALLGGNVNLGTTDQKVVDVLSGLGFPENDPTQPSRRQRRMDDSPLGDFGESYVAAFGSDPNLRTGRSAGRPVQVSDVLNPLDGITFAGTSDTPRGDDTAAGLTSAQILSNARNNIENARNLQNESSAELLAQIQPNQIDKTATDFEAPTVVDDPVKRAVQTLDDIGANTDTTVVTGPTVADAAKTDPVSIAAKQYADLLGGEKNDKMRNALMLASLGAGIAKGDTAGGLQQAANVAASYQQKEIERAEKGLDRAIKREDAASDKAIAMQRLNQTTEYYAGKKVSDALALEQTRERIQATQRQNEQSANNNALSFLTSSLDQQLKVNVGYRTMSPEEKYSTIKSILDGQASILKEFGHGASNNLDGMVERIARQRSGLSSNPAPTGQIAARYDSATGMRQ